MELSNQRTLPFTTLQHKPDLQSEPQALTRLDQVTDPRMPAGQFSPPVNAPAANFPVAPSVAVPPVQPAEIPVFLRNPGPPPELPRTREIKKSGRISYRSNDAGRHPESYRGLLIGCAVIGLALLFVLVVFQPQRRSPGDPVIDQASADNGAAATSASTRVTVRAVPVAEQYAVVIAAEGMVLEEPHDKAVAVQNLSQFTFVAFQRKSDTAWYQLKGGSGWIKALQVRTFETEEAAWDFKRTSEKAPTKSA